MTIRRNENRTTLFRNLTVYPFNLEAECQEIHDVDVSHQCLFAMTVEDCVEMIEYFDYHYFFFCHLELRRVVPAVIICLLWLFILFIALGVTSNCFLCPALFVISKHLGLSQNVAGVTLLAFGNGSPDIFSSAAGFQKASAEFAIASLVGAGVFVTTVVAGSVFLCQSFSLMIRPFLRDIGFYVVAVSWAFALFFSGRPYVFHGIGFVALYIAYIIVVLSSRFIYVKSKKHLSEKSNHIQKPIKMKGEKYKFQDDPETTGVVLKAYYFTGFDWFDDPEPLQRKPIYSIENGGYMGSLSSLGTINGKMNGASSTEKLDPKDEEKEITEFWNFLRTVCPINHEKWAKGAWYMKISALVKSPCILILKITVPVIDNTAKCHKWCRYLNSLHCVTGPTFICLVSGYSSHLLGGVLPVIVIIIAIGTGIALAVFCTSVRNSPPSYHWAFAYLGFSVSVVWIYLLANEIVALLQVFGIVFNLSDAILGLTMLAWGNSISDFLSNLAVARKEYPRMGISACFGGPLLALLLGLGVPCIIEVAKGRAPAKYKLQFSGQFVLLFLTVTVSIIMTTVAMALWKFQTRRWYGAILIALYVLFVILSVLEESHVFQIQY